MPEFPLPAGMKPGLASRSLAEHRSGSADHRLFLWAWLALAHRLSAAPPARAAA